MTLTVRVLRDIVRLTAQFVARNGRPFLTSLMSKEARNPQFDFLKPAHGLFSYFTKLLEQYTNILIPPRGFMPKLTTEIDDQQKIMDEVNYRVEWAKHQMRERAKEEEAVERERGKTNALSLVAELIAGFRSSGVFTDRLARFRRSRNRRLPTAGARQFPGKERIEHRLKRTPLLMSTLASHDSGDGRRPNASSRTFRSQCKSLKSHTSSLSLS